MEYQYRSHSVCRYPDLCDCRVGGFGYQRPTTYYEVGQGSIIKNVSYTGFAVRTEQTVEASKSGYLNFYQPEESKISAGQSVCAVSDKKLDLSNREEETGETQLTEDEQRQLLSSVRTFANNYREASFPRRTP